MFPPFPQFKPKGLFGELIESEIEQGMLTFARKDAIRKLPRDEPVLMKPMEIYGFLAKFVKASNDLTKH